ncbi:MAG TPA: hypothetical protein VJ306_11475 [Pyrinomonadaceae bacterium]|jgi:hypothetical protein|nr:hypothetical protein [Pyrinomonadaceae bacterium]
MSKSLLLMICLLTGLLVLACGKSAETNRNANATAANSSTPAPAASVVTNRNTNSSVAPEKIGIEECDAFLTSYDNCVSTKVPEAARAQYRQALTTWRTEWKKLADNPQTRGTLTGICKTQLNTARTQFKAYNCTF